jgi:predicted transcriptional regulator
MNINLLIDAIVRQTTILIAQLATSAGARAPLARTANQVFTDLVRELKQQGVGNKVIADMFGLALRTYHDKVVRLSESATCGGKSLWAAVLEFIQEKKVTSRANVLARFRSDDDASVRGVLRDLVESGLVFQSGRGDAVTYRAATPDDESAEDGAKREEDVLSLVWVAVNRYAPATVDEIAEAVPIAKDVAERALARLAKEGRVTATESGGEKRYACESCVIPLGATAGWEAAVFDHYQAMVTALCTKLRQGQTSAKLSDSVGGSTYAFDTWPGHPLRGEVLQFLASVRKMGMDLRTRVEAHNQEHEAPASAERVIAYVGQTVISDEQEGAD